MGVAGYPYKKYDGHKCIHVMELGSVETGCGVIFVVMENNIKYQWIDIFEEVYARELSKTH